MEIKLHQVIKRELKSRNISLNELARICKIPVSTLHGWGQGTPPSARNLHLLKNLSDYLSLSIAELLFNAKENVKESEILVSTTFTDSDRRYRLVIEKLEK
jgi:transcriptional regulator with XRE-family HTH domain